MQSIRQRVFALSLSLCAWGAAHAAITVNGTLDPSDPVLSGSVRVFRDGTPSTCAAAKAFPGTFGVGTPVGYKTATAFNDSGAPACITVNVDQGTCGVNAFTTVYLGSFNPNDLSQNYVADQGSSNTGPFSFVAPANSQIVLMTSAVNAITAPCTYTITSSELTVGNVNPVPALSHWAAWALTLLVAAVGVTAMRRRH